ncbi:MAG: N5-glutamine methyltransferase, modifies release factor, partial [Pseudomonadota bacterium]
MQLGEALKAARDRIGMAEARLLLRHATGIDHVAQQTHPERPLGAAQQAAFLALVERRASGEPVAYILGQREFYGRPFQVSSAVLIPRPETEQLVDVAIASMAARDGLRVLDLGTGSGVLAITLALMLPGAEMVAVDASSAALGIARGNAERLGARVRWVEGHWFSGLAGERFDLIVSNPPYIAARDQHLREGDLRFEPASALTDGSDDGLASLREIIGQAGAHLSSGGWLWLEHGFDQGEACAALLAGAGFEAVQG